MLDTVTFLAGFDGLPLGDSSGVSRWLDHVIALSEGGDVPMEQATVRELAFRNILWRIEHALPTGEQDNITTILGQVDWQDLRIRTAVHPTIETRSLQECFRRMGTLADPSGEVQTPDAVAVLAARGLAETWSDDPSNGEHRLFAALLAGALREITAYLNRLSAPRLSEITDCIGIELKRLTPTESDAISGATILDHPSAQAVVDWLGAIDDRIVAERLSSTSGYALYLLVSMVLRIVARASVPLDIIPDRVCAPQDGRVSDVAVFAALSVFSGGSFWSPHQVLATAAARAVVMFGYGRQLADELRFRAMLSSKEDLTLFHSLSDLGSSAEIHQIARHLSRIHCEYRPNPELTTVLGLLRLVTDGPGPGAEEDILLGLQGLALHTGSVTALSIVRELVRFGDRFVGDRIDSVLRATLLVWSDLDVARLCYGHASEFGEVHHGALMIILTDLLASEELEKWAND
jgi:hypothetical protein